MKSINKASIYAAGALSIALFFSSCSDKKEREELKNRADLLEQKLHKKDSAFNEAINTMAAIEKQIAAIKDKENIVTAKSQGDFSSSDKEQVLKDMQAIDQLIASSSETIKTLSSQLDDADASMSSFKKRINELNKSLENRKVAISELKESLIEKDVQIATLSTEVNTLSARVDLQTETIDMQMEKINAQQSSLNKAYFIVGTEKKLEEEGIVAKEGGFLWIGRTTELEADATKDNFTEINIKETDTLIIQSKKVKLITEHPSDSYQLISENDEVQYLSILNPDKFWGISKYLVISTKG